MGIIQNFVDIPKMVSGSACNIPADSLRNVQHLSFSWPIFFALLEESFLLLFTRLVINAVRIHQEWPMLLAKSCPKSEYHHQVACSLMTNE
jgi:hypothetical protein